MELSDGWEVAPSPPARFATPAEVDGLEWQPARVPGTAAGAVGADGRDFDAEDWWFRLRFSPAAEIVEAEPVLELDGIATVAEVFLNGERVLESESMWKSHRVPVGGLLGSGENELVIVCRALAPLLSRRRRPAARWRTRVVNQGNLRWYRTMMFGRSPGFAPGPAPVGPWRPVRLVAEPAVADVVVRTRVEGADGVVSVRGKTAGAATVKIGGTRVEVDGGPFEVELRVPDVRRWWPHTHGEPVLYELGLESADGDQFSRRVGFRSLRWADDIPEDGLDLRVNDVQVFVRGAVWTPADLVSMAPCSEELRSILKRVRDAGMNMLRVVGTGAYESPAFHDLCDELGILVWQDLMFANLDYPTEEPEFVEVVTGEARQALSVLGWRPSLAVVCGNSEVEQQPAMMGLEPDLGRSELWDDVLPGVVRDLGIDCAYVRSTPCGGDLPFHAGRGVTHYFGVSGYFRPVSDARRAEVRFATECLAFANVPDEVEVPVHHPRWKSAVARDAGTGWDLGAGWDFDDVRDHYLEELFEVDAVQLRRSEHERYLELSRAASGEVMAEVMGEWRRAASPCRGALVLWLKDMYAGAGLGVLDHGGQPKVAYHYLRRVLAPVAVWTTDEGVDGVAIHVANDQPESVSLQLRVALYRDYEARVGEVAEELELAPHGSLQRSVEGMLGRFVDAAWAYRFGRPEQDVIVVTLEPVGGGSELISQSVRFPARRPTLREPASRLGLSARVEDVGEGGATLSLIAERFVYGLRLQMPGFVPDDDAFSLEPGKERRVGCRRIDAQAQPGGLLTAINLADRVSIG